METPSRGQRPHRNPLFWIKCCWKNLCISTEEGPVYKYSCFLCAGQNVTALTWKQGLRVFLIERLTALYWSQWICGSLWTVYSCRSQFNLGRVLWVSVSAILFSYFVFLPHMIIFLTPPFPGSILIYVDRFSFTVSQKNKLLDWLCTCFKGIHFFIIEEAKIHCCIWDTSQQYDSEPSFLFALGSQAYQKRKVTEVWVWRHMKVTPVCVTPLPGFPFSCFVRPFQSSNF